MKRNEVLKYIENNKPNDTIYHTKGRGIRAQSDIQNVWETKDFRAIETKPSNIFTGEPAKFRITIK